VREVSQALDAFRDDVESFILMEATCCPGYTNPAVVNGAWDFAQINKRYESVLATVSLSAREMDRLKASPERLGRWLSSVRTTWEHALALDPLLPRELWPKGYLGEEAWKARWRSCRALAERMA
jgi:DNA-binding transcriptional regulator PaaX